MTYPDAKETKREITATTNLGVEWFTETERKIHAIGDELVDQRSRPFAGVWVQADPDAAALAAGVGVAIKATTGPGGAQYMVLATAAALAAGAQPLGVLMTTTLPGALGLVATRGAVPASGLGLGAGTISLVRANATTGVLERCAFAGATDAVMGICTAAGSLNVRPEQTMHPSTDKLGAQGWVGEYSISSAAGGVGEVLALISAAALVGTTPASIMIEADVVGLTDDAANSYSTKVMGTFHWNGAALNTVGSVISVFEQDDTGSGSAGILNTATAIKIIVGGVIDWRWFGRVKATYVKFTP